MEERPSTLSVVYTYLNFEAVSWFLPFLISPNTALKDSYTKSTFACGLGFGCLHIKHNVLLKLDMVMINVNYM